MAAVKAASKSGEEIAKLAKRNGMWQSSETQWRNP